VKKADIIFVVDSSGSIGKENFKKLRQFLVNIVHAFGNVGPDGNQFGLVRFATTVYEKIRLNSYSDEASLSKRLMKLL
jgi:collagen type VI alpha